jgi:hypothetical protein
MNGSMDCDFDDRSVAQSRQTQNEKDGEEVSFHLDFIINRRSGQVNALYWKCSPFSIIS